MRAQSGNVYLVFSLIILVTVTALLGRREVAYAVPAFAVQTGQPGAAYHIGAFGSQFTPFGGAFKIGGYTQGGGRGPEIATGSFTRTDSAQPAPNAGKEPFAMCRGERVAQLVRTPVVRVSWLLVTALSEIERGWFRSDSPLACDVR